MPLKLHPDIDTVSRIDFEVRLATIQARRLTAAVTYYQGKNAKIQSKIDKNDRKLAGKYEQAGKTLALVDKNLEKLEKLIREIEIVKGERGLNEDQLQFIDTEPEDEE